MMYYKTKPIVIEATKLTTEMQIGSKTGHPGDWMLVTQFGYIEFLDEPAFLLAYEAADEGEYPTRFKDSDQKPPRVRAPRVKKNGIAPEAKEKLEKDFDGGR